MSETIRPDDDTADITDGENEIIETPAEETAQQDAPPAPKEGETAQKSQWYHRRIAEEAARRREAEAKLRELEARYQQQTNPNIEKPEQTEQFTPDYNLLIEERAAALAAQRELERQARAVYQEGKKAFSDYDAAIQNLSAQGGEAVQRPEFLETVFDLPNAPAVLHKLGNDPELADEILSLPPLRMARRLEKLADALKASPPQQSQAASAAPEPITPIRASAGLSKKQENWGPAEWDSHYKAQRLKR